MEVVKLGKYILIGIPNCGKSTLGKRVADELNMPFFDTDTIAYSRMKTERISDMFRSSFQRQFREEQFNVMLELLEMTDDSAIIATGAEVPLIPRCDVLMRMIGTIIHIKRDLEALLEDARNENGMRLVPEDDSNGKVIIMREEAVKLYAKEMMYYEELAELTLENFGNEDEGVEKLNALITGANKHE